MRDALIKLGEESENDSMNVENNWLSILKLKYISNSF